ncbi:hypothetical protein Dsin_026440 [Dipteronia sinensis]|uniref:Uncharacterized protein n=1 Tax=Dipteronia sinensis TaxID=43782 RepID=A0AAD9ZXZ1_9ROSI|nr:hypothetical protein Dsin_026440 [Dipteronia sinensis]
MGGGTVNIDFPVSQFLSSAANPPSFSSSSSASASASASASNFNTLPLKQSWTSSSTNHHTDDTCKKIESVDRKEDKRAIGSSSNSVFGIVPSKFEVENAMTALQNFMHWISSNGPVLLEFCDLRTLIPQRYGRLYDAFRLLQTDSSVKRLVVSLATDKAIWDAVMNNESVRKLHESLYTGEKGIKYESSEGEPTLATALLRWILDATKAKIMELIEKFQVLVNEVLGSVEGERSIEEAGVEIEDKVRSSLLLSIVILLIVVVARAHGF